MISKDAVEMQYVGVQGFIINKSNCFREVWIHLGDIIRKSN
jgi:hypothetical protein